MPSLLVSAFCDPPNSTMPPNVLKAFPNANAMLLFAKCVYGTSLWIRGRILSQERGMQDNVIYKNTSTGWF